MMLQKALFFFNKGGLGVEFTYHVSIWIWRNPSAKSVQKPENHEGNMLPEWVARSEFLQETPSGVAGVLSGLKDSSRQRWRVSSQFLSHKTWWMPVFLSAKENYFA